MTMITTKDGTQIYYKDWARWRATSGANGTKHVAKAVLIGAIPSLMLKTAANLAASTIAARQ